jgi:hypothetical protein
VGKAVAKHGAPALMFATQMRQFSDRIKQVSAPVPFVLYCLSLDCDELRLAFAYELIL